MKSSIRFSIAALVALGMLLLANGIAFAAAPPPIPQQFFGSVSVDGKLASARIAVTAKVDGVQCASTVTDGLGRYGYDPLFYLSPLDTGTIQFYVAGKSAASRPFESGSVTQLDLAIITVPPPSIGASPTGMTFSGMSGSGRSTSQTLAISNSGGGVLAWSVSANVPWIMLNPTRGSVSSGGSSNVVVSFNASSLAAGIHTCTITVSAAGAANSPRVVPVALSVAAAPTPTPPATTAAPAHAPTQAPTTTTAAPAPVPTQAPTTTTVAPAPVPTQTLTTTTAAPAPTPSTTTVPAVTSAPKLQAAPAPPTLPTLDLQLTLGTDGDGQSEPAEGQAVLDVTTTVDNASTVPATATDNSAMPTWAWLIMSSLVVSMLSVGCVLAMRIRAAGRSAKG